MFTFPFFSPQIFAYMFNCVVMYSYHPHHHLIIISSKVPGNINILTHYGVCSNNALTDKLTTIVPQNCITVAPETNSGPKNFLSVIFSPLHYTYVQ